MKKKNIYKIFLFFLKLGYSLSKCVKILKINVIIEENDVDRKIVDNFLILYQSDWEERIFVYVLVILYNDKFNKLLLVFLVEDVVFLNSYFCISVVFLKESLKNGVDEIKYLEFVEVCLVQIILFNRKRSGEVVCIIINQYNEGLINKFLNKEIEKFLFKFENELCKSYIRIEIKGKRGLKVLIFFISILKDIVIILLKVRKVLKIDFEFIFIKFRNLKLIRGLDCLRKFLVNCGVKCFKFLIFIKLRKYLVIMCQVLEFSEFN